MRILVILFLFFICSDVRAQFVNPTKDFMQGIIIDMRPKESFKRGHIPGSINLTIEDLKLILQSGGYNELHNLCMIFGITPEKKVYIIPDDKESVFNALIFAGTFNFIGIKEVFILNGTYKNLLSVGLPETQKGDRLIYSYWTMEHTFDFLDSSTYKRLSNKKSSIVLNLDEKLEKSKNLINMKPDSFFQNGFPKTCEEINKIIFTGKIKEKKDIILKSNDICTLLGMKYLLSKVCGYDNVMVFKEESNEKKHN